MQAAGLLAGGHTRLASCRLASRTFFFFSHFAFSEVAFTRHKLTILK